MINVGIFTDNDFGRVNEVTTTLRAAIEHAPADTSLRVYTCDSKGTDLPHYLALRAPGCGIPYYQEMRVHLPPVRRLLKQARRDGLDVIHLTTPGPMGLVAMWIASQLQLPIVGSFHTNLADYTAQFSGSRHLAALTHQYLRWSYGKCLRVLVPSRATRDVLVGGRMDPARLRLWERGVSATRFTPARRSEALRRRWGATELCPAVLYVGRLSREKGLGDLQAVHRALIARAVGHRLVFVGDGPMRRELESMLPGAVFTGELSSDDVAVAMASSDFFVFPSRTDTAGNVILEAQASGLPVLVTDEGGPQEYMRPGETGVVCGSTRELCRQVIELCLRSRRRQVLGDAAREYALGRPWEREMAPLYHAYREVVRVTSRAQVRSAAAVA